MDKSWVHNLFTGDQGSANWIPLNPETDENYVPTWTPPQSPLPPKGK